MAARPSRLSKNRHGTYCLRWIVPVELRSADDAVSRREIRVSLRTTDPVRARILALEFNLALERLKIMTKDLDPRLGISPMTLTTGTSQWEIRNETDRSLFSRLLKDDKGLREAIIGSIKADAPPASTVQALVNEVKAATGALAPVPNPVTLKNAAEDFVKTRVPVSGNRRSTADEKARTIALLLAHLEADGRQADKTQVHEIRRGDLVTFIGAYASRPGKMDKPQAASAKRSSSKLTSAVDDANVSKNAVEKLSPRTVMKAIGHLEDFFTYAMGKDWVAINPMDEAFDEAIKGLRSGASSAKRSSSYELFTLKEISSIFEPLAYLKHMNAADDFWVPLIGLYTGARLGEIVTLPVDGIRMHENAACYVMYVPKRKANGDGPKNANSVREVPIPDSLVLLGLIDYVRHVQALGANVLFPHRKLNDTRLNDPSKHLSRAFGKHLHALAITSPTKVFHSLRHTVITYMHVNGVPVADAELIVGHAAQDAHLRMSTASTQRGGMSSTHLGTYVNAAGFQGNNLLLHLRLKAHLDSTLKFPIDQARLRLAAEIVQMHTVKEADGSFRSGWHTNHSKLADRMLKRIAGDSADEPGVQPASTDTHGSSGQADAPRDGTA